MEGSSGQLPGSFLPSGSAPIPAVGSQRKPKSPKSPGNRGGNQAGNLMASKGLGAGSSNQKSIKGAAGLGLKKPELTEIAAAPVVTPGALGQQPQQFTAVAVDAAGGATQIFPHPTTAAVLVATPNPGMRQMQGGPRGPVGTPQTANQAFLLQQQQYQQQALLAAQSMSFISKRCLFLVKRSLNVFLHYKVNSKRDVVRLVLSRFRCHPSCYRALKPAKCSRGLLPLLFAPRLHLICRPELPLKASRLFWTVAKMARWRRLLLVKFFFNRILNNSSSSFNFNSSTRSACHLPTLLAFSLQFLFKEDSRNPPLNINSSNNKYLACRNSNPL